MFLNKQYFSRIDPIVFVLVEAAGLKAVTTEEPAEVGPDRVLRFKCKDVN